MKLHTNEFKYQAKLFGKQINSEINYDGKTITKKNINSLKFSFNTELFRTIMKQVVFDINEKIETKTWVNPKFGYKVGTSYELLDYGNYYINKEAEYSADNKAYTHIAYDSMIESMILYDEYPISINYPISYKNMLVEIATTLGWSFTQSGFANENTMIEYDLYSGLGLTYRDILDDLCPASMGNMIITDNKELKIIYPAEIGDTIDKNYLDQDSINIGKKIGPINALVLSRAEDGDTINRRDEVSIGENGLKEIKIKDNLLLSSSFRENFIDEMFNKIKGFEYYEIDIKTLGLAYYDLLDKITINLDGNSYPTVILNCDLNIEGGVEEQLYSPPLEETVIDYTTSGLSDKGQKFANIIAYKNQAKIELVAKEIKDITDFIKNVTNQGDFIKLPNTPRSNGAIRDLRIKNFQLMELYPGMTYPSGFVYPGVLNFYMLIFDNVDTFNNNPHYVYINSPIPLQSLIFEGQTYHNELVIEENKVKIIQNIKWNTETEEYEILPIPTIHELNTVVLPTFEEDTYLRVDYFTDLIFEAEYLIKNEFTDTFTTQAESSSQFTINSEEIATKVSKDNIISEINQSPEAIKISANKIILEGNEEFTSVISQLNNKISDIQNQVDGKISTWYGVDAPTLYNYPADSWVTEEERNNHLGDLYYDDNGQAYRFSFQDNEYFWKPIADSDIQAIYEELNSKIDQTASNINLEVSKKTNKTEIISTINQSAEAVTINASKISLAGKTIDLTSDNIVIDSTNFKVTKAGVVTATGANISGTINATSGNIGGWRITDTLLGTTGSVPDTVFMSRTGQNAYINGFGISPSCCFYSKGNFAVTTDGKLYATNADISGKITATSGSFTGTITSTSGNIAGWNLTSTYLYNGGIGGTNGARLYNDGRLYMKNNYGWINTGSGGTILNGNTIVMSDYLADTTPGETGYTIGVRSFYGNIRISAEASPYTVKIERKGGAKVEVGTNVNIQGGYTAIQNLEIRGNNIWDDNSTGSANLYIKSRIVLVPGGGDFAYVNSATAGNRIATSSSGPSSKNVKENIKKLKYNEIYEDLQKLNTYTFDYKYKGIKDEKSDFGFIIDEVEELPAISKFVKHYDVEGYLDNNKLIPKRDNDKKQKNMTPFNYKEWDRDSYIKLLLLFIKSLQEKVDGLEEVVYGKTN